MKNLAEQKNYHSEMFFDETGLVPILQRFCNTCKTQQSLSLHQCIVDEVTMDKEIDFQYKKDPILPYANTKRIYIKQYRNTYEIYKLV